MTVTLGDREISAAQWASLKTAQRTRSVHDIASLLFSVSTNGDIASGREQLHPDWLSVFDLYRGQLADAESIGQLQNVDSISKFFGAIDAIDPVVTTIDPRSENIVFLLGAGASKPNPSDIPTVKELLPELLSRARRLDREQVTHLADFCDQQGIDNIEDLLTATQISAFCSRNPRILSLVDFQLFGEVMPDRSRHSLGRRSRSPDVSSVAYMQDTLQVLFGLLSSLMLPARPNTGHQAITQYVAKKPSTAIVTTNYDCCIDLALLEGGVQFVYTVDFANPSVLAVSPDAPCRLIKLHGSLNWFYCETCQKVRVIDIRKTVKEYTEQRGEYPIISVCNECGGQRRGLLVPPHAMKFDVAPPLQPLIGTASSCFSDSTLIVVVGFSFADADLYISRMLTKAMQKSTDIRMAIVDPERSVVERVRRKFASQIPNFDADNRIVNLQGDCAEILPRFLGGELLSTSSGGNDHQESGVRIASQEGTR